MRKIIFLFRVVFGITTLLLKCRSLVGDLIAKENKTRILFLAKIMIMSSIKFLKGGKKEHQPLCFSFIQFVT